MLGAFERAAYLDLLTQERFLLPFVNTIGMIRSRCLYILLRHNSISLAQQALLMVH